MAVLSKTMKGQPKELRAALVAVDPQSGGIRAYYGGDRGRGFFDDAAAARPPASTFKPIVLAAAEQSGIGFTSLWDGTSPRTFKDRQGVPLKNRRDLQCPVCPLGTAMVHSLNTPFYAVAERVGPDRVRDLAVAMGIPQRYGKQRTMVDLTGEPTPGRTRADIALGRYAVTPADLASVYGTLAAGGRRADRFLVESVKGADGTDWHSREPRHKRVLDAGIAADVSAVLSEVVAEDGPVPGHQAAAKTGTQQWGDTGDSADTWAAGYVPQLAAVTWIGRSTPGPVRDAKGRVINGDGMPYRVWRDFMAGALAGQQPEPLQRPAGVGSPDAGDATGPRGLAGLVLEDGDPRTALAGQQRPGQVTGPGSEGEGEAAARFPPSSPGTGPSKDAGRRTDDGKQFPQPQASASFPAKSAQRSDQQDGESQGREITDPEAGE
jgi:membrane peptidoglycan carboxypeptidase